MIHFLFSLRKCNKKTALTFHSFTSREKMKSEDDRDRQLECTVCFKKMRSNNLKRHMRKHRDLYSLAENDLREEIQERTRQYENRMERIRLVKDIAQEEEAPLGCIEGVEETSLSETLET